MAEEEKLRAPYASSGNADAILELFQRQNPPKIDNKFVVDHNITTSPNAFTITDFVKWLGITDKEGHVKKDVVEKLRMVGKEREDFIKNLIINSYKDLFEKVNIDNAQKDDIVNYFISYQKLGTGSARYAASLFLHLCHTYNISVAEGLKKKTHTGKKGGRPKSTNNPKPIFNQSKANNRDVYEDKNKEEIKKGLIISIKTPSTKFEKKFHTLEEFEKFLEKEWDARVNSWKLDLLEYVHENQEEGAQES